LELADILRRRRMTRSYLPDPIPREVIQRIVSTVRRAPSGGFSQGQRLVVVTAADTRMELARLAGEEEYVAAGGQAWISTAPVHVFVGTREESYHERYRKPDKLRDGEEIGWPAPYWYVDSGAAFMLLQLAAIDAGLATGVYGVLPEQVPEVKALLGVPDDVHFVCLVTIGHPAPDPGETALVSRLTQRRLPTAELVRWERWGGSREAPRPSTASSRAKKAPARSRDHGQRSC
jgi:FMN reductase [NAD(P)H]